MSSPAPGPSAVTLELVDAAGRPTEGYAAPRASLSTDELDLGDLPLQNVGPGVYTAQVVFPTAGAWDLQVSLRTSEFVSSARALGASPLRVSTLHVLRNVAPTLIVLATLQFPEALLVSAGLSFLGLGAQPPLPEWGALLTSARVYLTRAPWLVNFPGLAILITVLGLNLLGNALRDVLDPRLK